MMLSRIEHPCVQNRRVGLDFFKVACYKGKQKQAPPKTTQRYKMWSPAYTAKSILIQLQGNKLLRPRGYTTSSLHGVCVCVCLSIRPCIAFLFEGTAEIALQNLTDLSAYTERKRRWQSGVKFSVEQVNFIALKLHVAVKIN